jgi:hypothetical protein
LHEMKGQTLSNPLLQINESGTSVKAMNKYLY